MWFTLGVFAIFAIGVYLDRRFGRHKPRTMAVIGHALTTQEVIGQLRRLDPSGLRQVYLDCDGSNPDPHKAAVPAVLAYLNEDGIIIAGSAKS